ncbi:MAG TPA: PQQ-dependent sugar dehydrogenase [Actinomycetota bacterium]|nr:PQQ-dependent sugar dehydrogenase [Actinomycetota bacterium]
MRRILGTLIALALTAPLGSAAPVHAASTAVGAQLVVGGLAFPAAFTFAKDGTIYYGERYTGKIRSYRPSTGQFKDVWTIKNVVTNGEQGLLGLALHPDFPTNRYLFAYATRNVSGTPKNQIIRITVQNGVGSASRRIFTSQTNAGTYHDGGRILFGPDRRLYAVVGESHMPANAQNLGNNAGKILRMTGGGLRPSDNPFPNSLIWSYGHRNSFGFTFDPQTGLIWETEAGPSCNDEINLVEKGKNYGWGPSQTCAGTAPGNTNKDGPSPVLPLAWFTPTVTPTGIAFCLSTGCGLTGAQGTAFYDEYETGVIYQMTLTGDRRGIASRVSVHDHPATVLSMERGPDGALYFSSTDGGIYKLVQT